MASNAGSSILNAADTQLLGKCLDNFAQIACHIQKEARENEKSLISRIESQHNEIKNLMVEMELKKKEAEERSMDMDKLKRELNLSRLASKKLERQLAEEKYIADFMLEAIGELKKNLNDNKSVRKILEKMNKLESDIARERKTVQERQKQYDWFMEKVDEVTSSIPGVPSIVNSLKDFFNKISK